MVVAARSALVGRRLRGARWGKAVVRPVVRAYTLVHRPLAAIGRAVRVGSRRQLGLGLALGLACACLRRRRVAALVVVLVAAVLPGRAASMLLRR